jgi:hypothetical protein
VDRDTPVSRTPTNTYKKVEMRKHVINMILKLNKLANNDKNLQEPLGQAHLEIPPPQQPHR